MGAAAAATGAARARGRGEAGALGSMGLAAAACIHVASTTQVSALQADAHVGSVIQPVLGSGCDASEKLGARGRVGAGRAALAKEDCSFDVAHRELRTQQSCLLTVSYG